MSFRICSADDALDGLFRSVIQHHAAAAAYVFAGSQPSLMRAQFSERERPFYGQARPLELPPLPIDEAARDIEGLLRADGLDAGAAIDELLAFTGGHPQRTVLLAHHVYNLLDQPGQPEDLATAAIDLALAETRDAHQAVWDGLGRVERIVLLALATAKRQPAAGSQMNIELLAARCKTRSNASSPTSATPDATTSIDHSCSTRSSASGSDAAERAAAAITSPARSRHTGAERRQSAWASAVLR